MCIHFVVEFDVKWFFEETTNWAEDVDFEQIPSFARVVKEFAKLQDIHIWRESPFRSHHCGCYLAKEGIRNNNSIGYMSSAMCLEHLLEQKTSSMK